MDVGDFETPHDAADSVGSYCPTVKAGSGLRPISALCRAMWRTGCAAAGRSYWKATTTRICCRRAVPVPAQDARGRAGWSPVQSGLRGICRRSGQKRDKDADPCPSERENNIPELAFQQTGLRCAVCPPVRSISRPRELHGGAGPVREEEARSLSGWICVGKLGEKFWADAVKEYEKRLGAYCRLIVELPEARLPQAPSAERCGRRLRKRPV